MIMTHIMDRPTIPYDRLPLALIHNVEPCIHPLQQYNKSSGGTNTSATDRATHTARVYKEDPTDNAGGASYAFLSLASYLVICLERHLVDDDPASSTAACLQRVSIGGLSCGLES
jgi:hypothetical protein